jgi:ATP-binding cassette subfamily F protein uup
VESVGGWSDYLRQSMGRPRPAVATDGRLKSPVANSEGETGFSRADSGATERRKRTFNEEREFAALPARIEALETEQATLQAEASSPEFYLRGAEHINQTLARIDAIGLELEQALERWVELEEVGRP